MTTDAELIVNSYLSWIRNGVTVDALNDEVTELTTPFVDRHNDHLQVYAERRAPDMFLLSDDGYILSELKSSGVETHGSRREAIIKDLLVGHGVRLEGRELQTDATTANLGQKMHNLVQAMLSVDDMFILAQPTVQSIFIEEVAQFLYDRDIRAIKAAKFAGRSGLDHLISFVIPRSKTAPERFVQVLNSPRRDQVGNLLFAVNDTRSARPAGTTSYYVIVNDTRRKVPADILTALEAYEVKARLWSRRDEVVEELAS
ncbi:MAG: DUF1828 domain-containing protein [Gammaproteobacteria bacterium]